ncbi:MAG TPA: hypothetical protein PLP88_11610, partial [Bacteroidales bacterium]|nr:hypothetical protein [Bacteroidales bacterium]
NIQGWRTVRKIVVIESDDWGSIRMPSLETYQVLLKEGIKVDKCPYNRYDSLASDEDLNALFEVLIKFRDQHGNHPLITANTIVANPDFDKIKDSGFNQYFYEPFTETLQRYPAHGKSFQTWKQGMHQNIFYPQFHGREHLNVNLWLKMLRSGSAESHLAFNNSLFGISTTITTEKRKSYLAALDFEDISELEWQKQMLADGLDLFEKIFGFRSSSFIATNYTWQSDLEPILAEQGVQYMQGSGRQYQPSGSKPLLIKHMLGSRNTSGQVYLTRNCFFEPSLDKHKDWVNSALKEIAIAFFWHKPAIVSSHRLNFIGFIDPSNRLRNLAFFEDLLHEIINRWPDVEFMNTVQLGALINKSN